MRRAQHYSSPSGRCPRAMQTSARFVKHLNPLQWLMRRLGSSRPSSPGQTAGTFPRPVQDPQPFQAVRSSTAAELLFDGSLPRYSTLSQTLDNLIARQPSTSSVAEDDIGEISSGSGAITPGMTVELTGPPGIGKTSIGLGIVFSVTVGNQKKSRPISQAGEALIIGETIILAVADKRYGRGDYA
jgi:hypothetical protein